MDSSVVTITSVQITIRGDRGVEQNETFTVRLRNARQSTIQDPTGVGTIINDD